MITVVRMQRCRSAQLIRFKPLYFKLEEQKWCAETNLGRMNSVVVRSWLGSGSWVYSALLYTTVSRPRSQGHQPQCL
ncbi:hypothetical protein PT974_04049 [Cladobotryum mycophilum]|uniref:Uncharacterized protein n=1 Tax=Cladobotryum mycophilum TaxID=491253 RepID=A0ABR0STY9_9HYPO